MIHDFMEETNFIISLTTLPSRFKNLNLVLNSLCNQKYSNYEVHLNVSKEIMYDMPKLLYSNLKIFYVMDVGAVTKLYYTLQRCISLEQRIITVDDDFIYNKFMLLEYDNYIKNNSEITKNVFGFAGIYPVLNIPTDGKLNCIGALSKPVRVGIVEGYKSVCYKRNHFNNDFFSSGYKYHYNDDLSISAWLGINGIEKWCIPYRFEKNNRNRMLSFPLDTQIQYPKSGVSHQRDAEGGSWISYKKFYNSKYGKGIQR